MIGFFDSGFGGLTILKEVAKTLPDYSYIYLGDNARTPYGSRSQEIIYEYTKEGVEELFKQGAQIVVLACNTASAVALRKLQQDWLPKKYPERKILGIFKPTVEDAKNFNSKTIGFFATEATVESGAFVREIAKLKADIVVVQQACPLLVPIIEAGEFKQNETVVQKYVEELFKKNKNIGTVVLGCTHYAIIEDIFRKYVPKNAQIISQGELVAQSLKRYLDSHPDIKKCLKKECRREFLTTENSPRIKKLAEIFYGEKINLKVVKL
jgi:glutamate racemase